MDKIEYIWTNHKQIICFAVLFLFLCGLALFIFKTITYPASREPHVAFENSAEQKPSEQLHEGDVWKQTFISQSDMIDGVGIFMATYQKVNQGELLASVQNVDTGEIVYQETLPLNQVADNKYMRCMFPDALYGVNGQEFEVSISILSADPDISLSVWTSSKNTYPDGFPKLNDSPLMGDTIFQVYSGNCSYLITMFWGFAVFFLICLCLIYYLLFVRKIKVETAFVIVAAILGIGYTFLMTPEVVPDEQAHIETAYRHSNRMMFIDYATEDGKLLMRKEDGEIMDALPSDPDAQNYKYVADHLFKTCGDSTLVERDGRDVDTSKFVYIPGALGMTIGRLLNLGFIPVLYLGRFFNFAFYITLVYFAIKKMPIAKMLLFSVAVLPMSIHQAASLSSDSIIMALAFFFVGYFVKVAYGKDPIRWWDILLLCLSGAWLTLCKDGAYVPLCFLVLLIPSKQFASKKQHILIKALMVLLPTAIFLGNTILPMMFSGSGEGSSIVPWSGNPPYTLGWALHNPFGFVRVLVATFLDTTDFYLNSLWGGSLGWLNIQIPKFMGTFFIVLMLLSCLKKEDEHQLIKCSHKLWIFIVVVGAVLATEIGMFISWTPINNPVVVGVQGRYLLPILPALLLIVRNSNLTLKRDINKYIILAIYSLNIVELGMAFRIIVGNSIA